MQGVSKSISGFDPRSIPGCALWLDAADTATMNSTPTVTTWTDKSGQGNNVTGTATYSAGTMTFNGSTQAFSNTSYVFPSNAYSMFAVYSNTTAPGSTSYMNVVYGNGGYPMLGVYGSSKYVSARSVVANTGALSPNIVASNVLVSATYTPSTFSPFINGSAETTLTGTTLAATGIYIGGPTNYFNGSVSEILIYSATLTQTQRQSVEGYLSWKWGKQSSLPAIHPFYSLPAFSRPFGPLDIPGCALWFDAADATTFTLNGSTVASWRDKSGNGYSVGQSTASNQPTYAAGLLNGLPGIQLSPTTYLYQPGSNMPIFASASSITVFIVAKNGSSTSVGNGWNIVNTMWFNGVNNATTRYHFSFAYITTNGLQLYANGSSVGQTTAIPFGSNAIIGFTISSSGNSINANGTLTNYTGTASSSAADSTWFMFGDARGTFVSDVNIYEFVGFTTVLTTTQRQQVEGYLAAKWGLLNNLPGATFSPLTVSGCVLWLDAADTSTLMLSTNNVTQWSDKSGSGNNATQATAGSQPTTGGSQNGLNTLLFTGKTMTYPTISLSAQTVFCVYLNNTFTPYGEPVAVGPFAFFYAAPSSNVGIGRTGVTDEVLANWSTNGLTTSKYTVYGGTVSVSGSTTSVLYFNGNQVASNTVTSSGGASYYRIGHYNGGTTGYIAEVIVFNSVLGTAQRQSVENYLMRKWGISNVTTHPFKSIPPSTSQPPQFQEVTPGNWTYDWKPYLSNLAAANSGATASIGTSITPSVSGGFAATLAPNGNLYTYSWSGTGITVVNTNSGSLVTTITGTGIQGERYFSSCLGPDGNIYYPPYNLSTAGILYTATNTFSASAITMGTSPSSGAYCGAVLAPNGKIYCIPRAYANAASIGIIDTVAKTFNIMASAVVTANQGYIGGVLAPNGKIYCIPFVDGGSVSVGIVDPDANTFTTMPSSSVSTVGAYNGGVLAPNGKIYCIPYNATNVGIIDPVANTFNTTTITNAPGSAAYTGGCLGPNGKIYFASRSATAFGVVDPVANTLATTGGVSGTSGTGYTGAFLTSAGKFYCPNLSTVVNVVNFSSLNQTPSLNYCLSAYTNKS